MTERLAKGVQQQLLILSTKEIPARFLLEIEQGHTGDARRRSACFAQSALWTLAFCLSIPAYLM